MGRTTSPPAPVVGQVCRPTSTSRNLVHNVLNTNTKVLIGKGSVFETKTLKIACRTFLNVHAGHLKMTDNHEMRPIRQAIGESLYFVLYYAAGGLPAFRLEI
jgi:hypothetical protein